MHAKKARDRKKVFLESSDKLIEQMEYEVGHLRSYLLSISELTSEDIAKREKYDIEARNKIISLNVLILS